MHVQLLHYSWCISECFCEGGDDKRIPLLRDVFEAFPNTPVNIDIKANNDTLIKKVRVDPAVLLIFHFLESSVCAAVCHH